jgi:predicted acylesterase/phospholipase RssA
MSNENTDKVKYPFKGMVFEGGGSLGVAHVGAVKVF